MKKFNQLFILGTSLLLSAAALTGCSGSSAMGATIPQTTASETTTPQTDAGLVAAETTGSGNRLNDILERGYIEIATEPYFAPNEFIDPTKSGDEAYVGSDIELANYIGESLGVEVRIKPMDFTSVLGSITTGKYDLAISALAYTPARAETQMNPPPKGGFITSETKIRRLLTVSWSARKMSTASNPSMISRTRLSLHRTVPFRNSSYRNRSRAIKNTTVFLPQTMVS